MELFRSISQQHRDFSHLAAEHANCARPCGHADNSWKILLFGGVFARRKQDVNRRASFRANHEVETPTEGTKRDGCVERRKG